MVKQSPNNIQALKIFLKEYSDDDFQYCFPLSVVIEKTSKEEIYYRVTVRFKDTTHITYNIDWNDITHKSTTTYELSYEGPPDSIDKMHDLCAERSCTALFNELLETLTPARKKYLNNFIDKAYGRTKAGVRNYGDGNTLGEKLTTFFLSKYSHFTEFLQDKVKLKGVITAFFKGIKQTLRQDYQIMSLVQIN